jgi:hypothetical protein
MEASLFISIYSYTHSSGHDKPRAGPSSHAKQLQQTGNNFTILVADGTSLVISLSRLAGGDISALEIHRCFFGPTGDDCLALGARLRSIPWLDVPDDVARGSPSRESVHPTLP